MLLVLLLLLLAAAAAAAAGCCCCRCCELPVLSRFLSACTRTDIIRSIYHEGPTTVVVLFTVRMIKPTRTLGQLYILDIPVQLAYVYTRKQLGRAAQQHGHLGFVQCSGQLLELYQVLCVTASVAHIVYPGTRYTYILVYISYIDDTGMNICQRHFFFF